MHSCIKFNFLFSEFYLRIEYYFINFHDNCCFKNVVIFSFPLSTSPFICFGLRRQGLTSQHRQSLNSYFSILSLLKSEIIGYITMPKLHIYIFMAFYLVNLLIWYQGLEMSLLEIVEYDSCFLKISGNLYSTKYLTRIFLFQLGRS